jgi:hypothetical protein
MKLPYLLLAGVLSSGSIIFAAGDEKKNEPEESQPPTTPYIIEEQTVPKKFTTWRRCLWALVGEPLPEERYVVDNALIQFALNNPPVRTDPNTRRNRYALLVNLQGITGTTTDRHTIRFVDEQPTDAQRAMLRAALFDGARLQTERRHIYSFVEHTEEGDILEELPVEEQRFETHPAITYEELERRQTIWPYLNFTLAFRMLQFAQTHNIGTEDEIKTRLESIFRMEGPNQPQRGTIIECLQWIERTYGKEFLNMLLNRPWNHHYTIRGILNTNYHINNYPGEHTVPEEEQEMMRAIHAEEAALAARAHLMVAAQKICNQLGITLTAAILVAITAYLTYFNHYPDGSH